MPDELEKVVFDPENEACPTRRTAPRTDKDGDRRLRPGSAAFDAELAKPLGLPASTSGLVVTSVKDGSPAEEEGIEEGDVITKVVATHATAGRKREGFPGPRVQSGRDRRLRAARALVGSCLSKNAK